MSAFTRALLDEITSDQLAELATHLRPYLEQAGAPPVAPARWLNARDAAQYLGITVNALHKRTAAREIPFEQDVAGGKLWFHTPELDAWRRGERATRGSSADA